MFERGNGPSLVIPQLGCIKLEEVAGTDDDATDSGRRSARPTFSGRLECHGCTGTRRQLGADGLEIGDLLLYGEARRSCWCCLLAPTATNPGGAHSEIVVEHGTDTVLDKDTVKIEP